MSDRFLFSTAERWEVLPFIKKWHYSQSLPAAVCRSFAARMPGGLFGDTGEIAAVCSFAEPVMANSRKPGVLELVRLARTTPPTVEFPLSMLVSWGLRWLSVHEWPKYRIVLSYADWAHDHHGGIYQACNFSFVGKRAVGSAIGYLNRATGEMLHERGALRRFNTGSRKELEQIAPHLERVEGKHKYLYVYPLARGKRNQEALLAEYGYTKEPYPKPEWPGGVK